MMGQQPGLNNEDDTAPLSLDRWLEREHHIGKDSLKIETIEAIGEPPPNKVSTNKGFVFLSVCSMIAMFLMGYVVARIQPSYCPAQAVSSKVNQIP
jgi:hypothetical protein